MKILVAWDDPNEADVLRLYLSTPGNEVSVALSADDLLNQAGQGPWDALLLALTFPASADEGYALFEQVRRKLPGLPVVLACRPTELIHLPRFLNHGLRFHITRDNPADFVFLVMSSLESAVAAGRAEESHKQLERLRQYLDEH